MSCVACDCVNACCVCLLVRISLIAVSSALLIVARMIFFFIGSLPSSFWSSSFQNDGLARIMLLGCILLSYSLMVSIIVL